MQIVDRRKLNEAIEVPEKPSKGFKALEEWTEKQTLVMPKKHEKRIWKDVAFMIAFMNINGNQVISGRAVGLRSDDRAFVADYLFTPVWERGLDWTAISEERLNTFLDCGCQDGTACEMHKKTCEQWLIEGVERIQNVGAQGVPMAVEAFMKAQQQRPQIITPGR